MSAKAALANGLWLGAGLGAWVRYQRALAHPERTQCGILSRLIADNADSAYGRAHGFRELRSYEAFRERVPIVDYEVLEPWITRIRHGESKLLTSEPVTRLVPTSGSTGARKLIPFTAGLQHSFNAAISPWIFDLARQHPSIPLGPAYWSISPVSATAEEESSAVPIGFDDDSAYLGGIRRRLVESTFAVPVSLRSIADVDAFRYATLLCLLRQRDLRLYFRLAPLVPHVATGSTPVVVGWPLVGCVFGHLPARPVRRETQRQPSLHSAPRSRPGTPTGGAAGHGRAVATPPSRELLGRWAGRITASRTAPAAASSRFRRRGLLATEACVLPDPLCQTPSGGHPPSHFFEDLRTHKATSNSLTLCAKRRGLHRHSHDRGRVVAISIG